MFNRVTFVFFNLILVTSLHASVSVEDDRGNIISLPHPAKRIISLAPHITESLFSAGAGDKIVGTVSYSDYPEAAKKITRIGGYPLLDVEKITSLKPDLIIAWSSGSNLNQVEKLQALGFSVFLSEPRYPKDIASTIQRFGILAGTQQVAMKSSEKFTAHYKLLKKRYADKSKVKVFYQFWNKPIMTINGQHIISDIINLCGGTNVFSDLKSMAASISIEAAIAADADVIVVGAIGDKFKVWSLEWKRWNQITAVKNDHIFFIDPDLLNRMGPRILQGAEKLCKVLNNVREHKIKLAH